MLRRLIGAAFFATLMLAAPVSYGQPASVLARSDVEIHIKATDIDAKTKKIVRHEAMCSGVYLGNRIIATAAHCVKEGKIDSITVILDVDGREYGKFSAHQLAHSEKADVALLQVDTDLPAQSAELACREPDIGESLELVGNPLGLTFIHTWGRVSGVMRDLENDAKLVPIDVMIAPGNSGGPVYDKDGKVLGLADMMFFGPGGSHVDMMVSSLAICGAPGVAVAQASVGPGTRD